MAQVRRRDTGDGHGASDQEFEEQPVAAYRGGEKHVEIVRHRNTPPQNKPFYVEHKVAIIVTSLAVCFSLIAYGIYAYQETVRQEIQLQEAMLHQKQTEDMRKIKAIEAEQEKLRAEREKEKQDAELKKKKKGN